MSDEIELLIAADCTDAQHEAMTYTKWKDGIDLAAPTVQLVELVRLARETASECPSDAGCSTANEEKYLRHMKKLIHSVHDKLDGDLEYELGKVLTILNLHMHDKGLL